MDMKEKDCSIYENCLDTDRIDIDLSNDEKFHMLAVGCWGVYCNEGDCTIFKYKKGALARNTVTRGQGKVSEALIAYTKEHNVSDMYLAGDNIYQEGVSDPSQIDEFEKEKRRNLERNRNPRDPLENFNIEKQLSQGFENCFMKADINRFFLASGNHDIETCEVISKEINYPKWNFPSLYYQVVYKLYDYTINIIVLDTNMFDEGEDCSGKPFTEEQIQEQERWSLSKAKNGDWNIAIGHVPYYANGHSEKKPVIKHERLEKLIHSISPQIYICADEHNQQLIEDEKTCIVVAGSGGTALDDILGSKPVEGTLFQNKDFGFVSYEFTKEDVLITFLNTRLERGFQYLIK